MAGKICYSPVLHSLANVEMRVLPEHKDSALHHANTNHEFYRDRGRDLPEKIKHIFIGKLGEIVIHSYQGHLFQEPPALDCKDRVSDDGFDFKTVKPLVGFIAPWSYTNSDFLNGNTALTRVESNLIDLKCVYYGDRTWAPTLKRSQVLKATGKWGDMRPYYVTVFYDEKNEIMKIMGYVHYNEMTTKPDGLLREDHGDGEVMYITLEDLSFKMEDALKVERVLHDILIK